MNSIWKSLQSYTDIHVKLWQIKTYSLKPETEAFFFLSRQSSQQIFAFQITNKVHLLEEQQGLNLK